VGHAVQWTRHEVSLGHEQLRGIEIADLDRDGFGGLVAVNLAGDEVRRWLNDDSPADGIGGDGNSWTEGVIDGQTETPRSALPRDVDRDGDLDILVTSQISQAAPGRVVWWLNDGTATTWTPQTVGSSAALAGAAVDVDRAGDIDVLPAVGTGSVPGQIILYRQQPPGDGTACTLVDGLGGFDPGEFFPTDVALADLDFDGDLDAASPVQISDGIYWWENPDSDGGWPRQDPGRVAEDDVSRLRAGQVDGRGPVDLVAASTGDGIAMWENQAAQAELLASNLSPAELAPSSRAPLLRVNARRLGRVGDNLAEIAILRIRLSGGDGLPLSDATAN
jgi:hypothetical protein